jgi:hypothetical protein
MTGAERISALCINSRAHCSTRVATSAQVRLSPRLINQRMLHTSELVCGVKAVGGMIVKVVPFAAAASWFEIWFNRRMVVLPESGVSVL